MKTPCCLETDEEKYGIPTLEELGQDPDSFGEELYPGGEQEALRRLDEHMNRAVLNLYYYTKPVFLFVCFLMHCELRERHIFAIKRYQVELTGLSNASFSYIILYNIL